MTVQYSTTNKLLTTNENLLETLATYSKQTADTFYIRYPPSTLTKRDIRKLQELLELNLAAKKETNCNEERSVFTMDERQKRKDPGFPIPPSFTTGDNQQTNDLMTRLQSFLPQMEAANQALSSDPVGQVDIELKKDSGEEDSDDDSSNASGDDKIQKLDKKNALISESKGEGESDDEEGTASQPTIQIQFALTDPNNPMMELFANDNEKKGEENEHGSDDEDDDDDDQESPLKVRAVKSMLKSASSTKQEEPPAINILHRANPTPKKSLITELS